MKKALTFDIGGTKISCTIIDETGKVVGDIEKFSTPKTIDGIKDIIKKAVEKYNSLFNSFSWNFSGYKYLKQISSICHFKRPIPNKPAIGA